MDKNKRDWKDIIEKSNGTMMMMPDLFIQDMKDIENDRKELNEYLIGAAEREIKLNVRTQNMFLSLREYLVKNGLKNVWAKDIGLNVAALEDGKFVVNFSDVKRAT